MTAYTPDWTLLTQIFQNTQIFGLKWIIGITLTMIITVALSRNTKHWILIATPTFIGLRISGLRMGTFMEFFIIVSLSLAFVINSISVEVIGNYLTARATTRKIEKEKYGTTLTDTQKSLMQKLKIGEFRTKLEDKKRKVAKKVLTQDLLTDPTHQKITDKISILPSKQQKIEVANQTELGKTKIRIGKKVKPIIQKIKQKIPKTKDLERPNTYKTIRNIQTPANTIIDYLGIDKKITKEKKKKKKKEEETINA